MLRLSCPPVSISAAPRFGSSHERKGVGHRNSRLLICTASTTEGAGWPLDLARCAR